MVFLLINRYILKVAFFIKNAFVFGISIYYPLFYGVLCGTCGHTGMFSGLIFFPQNWMLFDLWLFLLSLRKKFMGFAYSF